MYVQDISPFSLYGSNSPSIRGFSCTLYKAQELRRRFVGATRSIQGKLLSVSLKASVKRRSEPLNDRCFDFTDKFKHSDLRHFTLQNLIQHKKSKTKKQLFFCETVFISKLNLKMEISRPGNYNPGQNWDIKAINP